MSRLGLPALALVVCLGALAACAAPVRPEPIASPVPGRLSAATPIPSPTSSPVPDVAILSVRGRTMGMTNAVIAHAPPGQSCTLDYTQPAGPTAPFDQLAPAIADSRGEVRWVWTLSPRTPIGMASVTVTCGEKSVTTTFFVEIPPME